MTTRNIYIVGAGAIGKALAVFLKHKNLHVVLIRGSVDDQPSRMESITINMNDGSTKEADIEVRTLNSFEKLEGVIVLTNKSFGNGKLSQTLIGKTGDSPIVLLQNGLGVEQPFTELNFPAVYRCVLFVTSQQFESGNVRFKPVAPCPVGVIRGDSDELANITELLSSTHFQFVAEANIQQVIWKKAIINSAFNSICPLLETDNGIFHRDAAALEIATRVVNECILVARASGVELNTGEVLQSLLLISKASDGQLISTLVDIRHQRQTEIETLNFEFVRIAATLHIEDAIKETKLLGELTRLKSLLTLK